MAFVAVVVEGHAGSEKQFVRAVFVSLSIGKMNEPGSLMRSRREIFNDTFTSLPSGRDEELRILDVGCSAEFYKTARITGIDTFEHASLKRSSLERAKENSKILGFSDRIDFKKVDIFGVHIRRLVLHNFGKMRFKARHRGHNPPPSS